MKPTVTKSTKPTTSLGIDLGDRKSHYCLLSVHGEVKEGIVAMTQEDLLKLSKQIPRSYVILESGSQSSWVARLFSKQHHEVTVANARRMSRECNRGRKNDRADARMLARRGISDIDRANLYPVTPRSEQTQIARAVVHTRDLLVRTRVSLKLRTKSLCKELGARLPNCSTSSFPRKVRQFVPKALMSAIEPLLTTMESIEEKIQELEKELVRVSELYPATQVLQTVKGVGVLTSLSFVLTIEDPKRFGSGRDVPAFLGLVPGLHQSGKSDPQLSITKAGNGACRRLLVLASQYILGPKNKLESDLRTWGLKLAERGGKSGKKRAIVAVARKLSVILHRMWLTGEAYKPKITKAEQSQKRKVARTKKKTKSAA